MTAPKVTSTVRERDKHLDGTTVALPVEAPSRYAKAPTVSRYPATSRYTQHRQ